jgi:Family of unknown function (DUF6600)
MNKTKLLAGKLAVVLCATVLGQNTYAQPSVSVGVTVPTPSVGIAIHADSDFYEPLTPHGEWVSVGAYGRCWRPGHVARDWRPYCSGNWELTDDGWYWVSDEPWAWATYHYGRWDFTDQYGWYWVPQVQWAPAWVSWHEGGGYVGWAPLQPSVSISVNGYVGFNQSHIPSRAFVFVEQRHFMDPIRSTTVVANNTTVINKTTVISNTKIVNNTVINGGPTTTVIEKASGRKVQAVPVRELRQKQEAPVVARQKTVAPADKKEKTVQAPVSRQVKPAGEKMVAAPAPPPVEKPNLTPRSPAPPTPTGRASESEKARTVPARAEHTPEAVPPTTIKEPAAPKAGHLEKQEKPATPSDKKMQQPDKEKPAAREKNEPNSADKEHENKGKE